MVKLDSKSFDEWLEEQQPFDLAAPKIDLDDIEFISPAALVQLAALIYSLAAPKVRPALRIDGGGVSTYLSRAGFCSAVSPVCDINFPTDDGIYRNFRGSNPMLIEVTRIKSSTCLPKILDNILWVLRNRLKYSKNDSYDVATMISEIGQNTFDHNQQTSGFLAMQVYKGAKPFLEIGIADHGLGLAQTLRRNPKYDGIASDSDAITVATELGSSQHSDPTRGTGLHHLLDTTYKHAGTVQIRSGNAKFRFRMDRKLGWSFRVPKLSGVQIALNLPSK